MDVPNLRIWPGEADALYARPARLPTVLANLLNYHNGRSEVWTLQRCQMR